MSLDCTFIAGSSRVYVLAKILAGKSISEMIYFVSVGTFDLNSVSKFWGYSVLVRFKNHNDGDDDSKDDDDFR